MTNYEEIKNYTIEEMAKDRITSITDDYGYMEFYGDFKGSKMTWTEALKYEIEWLNDESC